MNPWVITSIVLAIFAAYVYFARRAQKRFRGELLQVGERARKHERRAAEYLGLIEGLEGERDTWQRFYFEIARKSGVAQNWLLRDLQGAVLRANAFAQELRKRGVKAADVIVDPALKDVLGEYSQEHPAPPGTVPKAPGLEEAKKLEAGLGVDRPA
jgi:hypothetical protein